MVLGCALLHPTYGDSIALPMPTVAANLLADLGENPLSIIEQPLSQTYDLSIGKFGTLEGTVAKISIFNNSEAQINFFEERSENIVRLAGEYLFFENNVSQISVSKVGLNEDTTLEGTIAQVSSTELTTVESTSMKSGIANDRPAQIGIVVKETPMLGITPINVTQIGIPEVNLNQATVTQVGMTKIGFSERNFLQLNPTQINTSQIHLVEQLLPLPFTQINEFFTGHNFSLQNTTIPTWTEFLTGTTPFNLNIEITDPPTGQLSVRAALLNFHRAVKEGRYQLE
jgi:hypothetical protein